jgi:tRNA (Thr-GGU) A37 N-methylase
MHPIFPLDNEGNIKIKPIGYVSSPVTEQQTGGFADLETEIHLGDEFVKCLDGIDEFSHILVLYWLHDITEYRESCRPQGREDVPMLGQLATR